MTFDALHAALAAYGAGATAAGLYAGRRWAVNHRRAKRMDHYCARLSRHGDDLTGTIDALRGRVSTWTDRAAEYLRENDLLHAERAGHREAMAKLAAHEARDAKRRAGGDKGRAAQALARKSDPEAVTRTLAEVGATKFRPRDEVVAGIREQRAAASNI